MQNGQLSPEKKSQVSSTGEDKSAMSSSSSKYQKRSESPTSSSTTSSSPTSSSSGSSISKHTESKMFDSTTTYTSESHEETTNELIEDPCEFDRISLAHHNRNDESLQMNANNCSRTTQPARAISSTTTEDKPTTSITTASNELDHKRSQEEIRHLSGPTALPEDRAFECPGAFINNLLSLEGEMVFYALYFYSVHGEVCIHKDDTAEYILLRASGLNHHRGLAENQHDDRFRCLVYAPDPRNDAKRVPFHCYEDLQCYHAQPHESHKRVLAKFVRLGGIQKRSLEAGMDQESKHTTNYVLLWNISTKPHSLWICYDYYTADFEGTRRRCQLGKPTYYDEAYDFDFGPQTRAFDLEANLESDDESASHTFSYPDVFSDEYFRDDADDYELLHEVLSAELLPSRDNASKNQTRNPGYFGIDRPFDLAVLASDINEWDGDTGLKRESMYKCLETIRFRLGDTLRARAWVSTVQPES